MSLVDIFKIDYIKENLEMYRPTKSSILNEIFYSLKNNKIDFITDLVSEFMRNGKLVIDSPITGESSSAVLSSNQRGSQYILMKTEANEFWIIVQSQNFIDCIITPNHAQYLFHRFLGESTIKGLMKTLKYFEGLEYTNVNFNGFYINNVRPFHFFYDNLKALIYLKKVIPKDLFNKYEICIENGFYKPDSSFNNIIELAEPNKVYIAPLLISQRRGNALNNEWSKLAMEDMEYLLRDSNKNQALDFPFKKDDYDLVLWIGITGQKRSWIEQVIGYSSLINELNKNFKEILVIVDGITARHSETIHVPEDIEVYNRIKRRCGGVDSVEFISVIGNDYTSKIRICNEVDFFIANAGSGSVTPLRFCKKDGILHSNFSINTFKDDYKERGQSVFKINDKHIIEENLNLPSSMNVSYHLSWKYLYNALIRVINDKKNILIAPVNILPEDTVFNHVDEITMLRILGDKFKVLGVIEEQKEMAEIFKEIAISFEKSGNYEVAQTLMLQALRLKPNSKIIKDKFTFYSNLNEEQLL